MKSNQPSLAILLALGILLFGGLATYVAMSPNAKVPDEMKRQNPPQPKEGEAKIFTPKPDGNDITLDADIKPVPKGENPMVFAVNQFLEKAKVTDPKAKLLGVELEADGLAILYFNQAFRQTYGTHDEMTLLDGIRASMGQFPAVNRIKFTIEGEALETLGGVDLTEPIDVLPERDPVDPAPSSS
jgi:hypothetical protein